MSLVYWAVHETSGCGRFWKRDKLSGYDVKGRETVMLKERGFGISPGLPSPVLTGSMRVGRPHQLSEPQFPHLDNGDNQTYPQGYLRDSLRSLCPCHGVSFENRAAATIVLRKPIVLLAPEWHRG